jgi:hypothetical protein
VSDLTTELNLTLAVDGDDLADYLDADPGSSLRTSLKTIDGLFNSTTGHTHNGAHQGGPLSFTNLTVGGNLTVNGSSTLVGGVYCQSSLNATGATTLSSTLDVTGATHLKNTLVVDSNTTLSGPLGVTGTLTAAAINASGTVTAGGFSTSANATVSGTLTVGTISATTVNTSGTETAGQLISNGDLRGGSGNLFLGPTLIQGLTGGDFHTNSFSAYANGDVSVGAGAQAVNATAGYAMIPRMGGNPTGVPANLHGGGWAPIVFAPGRLYLYDGSAWHYATLT